MHSLTTIVEPHQRQWEVAEADIEAPVQVFIHNDDITPMDFVEAVLIQIFELPQPKARAVMWQAHYEQVAWVAALPLEDAKYQVATAHAAARAAGYPLRFTIETTPLST
jgi:ATP-dependent Clp protease adaptor protein ClpS